MIDVAQCRAETPGVPNVLHFNNAGAALPPEPVVEAQVAHVRREAAIGGYEAAAEAKDAIDDTYAALSDMLHCDPDEVALMQNATRAWDMAFYGFPFEPGDRILTSQAAYASNYIAGLQVARRTGATIEAVPSDETGQIDLNRLENTLDDDVALVALTHVPTNGGLVNPAAEVGALCRAAGVPLLLDACQSAGQMPLNVDELGCTMLSATGRKYLRGPRGTGFLYVQRDWIERIEPPLLDLRAATWTAPDHYEIRPDATRFETFETYVGGQVALGTAVRYAMNVGLDAIFERVQHLAATLRTALADVPGVTVTDQGRVRCGITTFYVEGMDAAAVQSTLRERAINTSVSSPASTRLDATTRALPDLVRASVHYYNTEAEIHSFVEALSDVM